MATHSNIPSQNQLQQNLQHHIQQYQNLKQPTPILQQQTPNQQTQSYQTHYQVIHRRGLHGPIKGILLDISGVLKDGDIPIRGSVEAVKRLQKSSLRYRVVTNETLKPKKTIHDTLNLLGYEINEQHMFSPVPAMIEILRKEELRPHLLVHPRMIEEFQGIDVDNPNCVVIGDAEEFFTYESLNECFRKLIAMDNPSLFSLGIGKYYLDDDGLALDVGSFTKGIEYATGVTARIVGKPSAEFFLSAVRDMKLEPSEVVMIGDDIENDVGGAQKCGMRGVLVRTGKFRKSDERHVVKPDAIFNNLLEAVTVILEKCQFNNNFGRV